MQNRRLLQEMTRNVKLTVELDTGHKMEEFSDMYFKNA